MNFFLVLHLRQINAATTIKAIEQTTATTPGTAITTGCVADCPPEEIQVDKKKTLKDEVLVSSPSSYQFALQQEHLC